MHIERKRRSLLRDRMAPVFEAGSYVRQRFLAVSLLGLAFLLSHPTVSHGQPEDPRLRVGYNTFLSFHGTELADGLGITGEGSVIVVFDSGIASDPSFTPLFEACAAVAGEPVCADGPGIHIGEGVATHDSHTSWHGDRVTHTAHVTAPGAEVAPVSIVDGDGVNSFENLTAAIPAALDYLRSNYPDLRPVMMYAATLPVANEHGVRTLDGGLTTFGLPVPDNHDCDTYIPALTQAIQEARRQGIPFIVPVPLEDLKPGEKMYPACIEGTVPVVGVEGYDLRIPVKDAAQIDKPMLSAAISVDVEATTRSFVGRGHSHAVAIAAGLAARSRQSPLHWDLSDGLPIYDENGTIVRDLSFIHTRGLRRALGLDAYSIYLSLARKN